MGTTLERLRPQALPTGLALQSLTDAVAERQALISVTGENASELKNFARRAASECRAQYVVRFTEPANDPVVFLRELLEQLGFESFVADIDDYRRLVTLFLRHEATQGRCSLLIVEQAERCAARVIHLVRSLAQIRVGKGAAITCLLVGSPGVDAILDAPAMQSIAPLIAGRWRLDQADDKAEPAGPALLVNRDGQLLGQFRIRNSRVMIGRHAQNDLTIPSRFISRHHAMLVNRPEGVLLVDLKSTNGTLVNSIGITQKLLRDGDIISLGNFRLKFIDARRNEQTADTGQSAADVEETRRMRSLDGIHDTAGENGDSTQRVARLAG